MPGSGPLLVLEPKLPAQEADRRLRREAGVPRWLPRPLRWACEPLQAVDLAFVPHWFFRLALAPPEGGAPVSAWLVIEALSGAIARTGEAPVSVSRTAAGLAPAAVLSPRLDRQAAEAAALERLRWEWMGRRRVAFRPPAIAAEHVALLYVPFWLGYFGEPPAPITVLALHAVAGTIEGPYATGAIVRALVAARPQAA